MTEKSEATSAKEKTDAEIRERFYENMDRLQLAWYKSLPEQDRVLFGESGEAEYEEDE